MKIENVEITKFELAPFLKSDTPSSIELIYALISHQLTPVSGFPKLMENMKEYRQSHFSYIQINGIKYRLFYNPTRKTNVLAETFTQSHDNYDCPLCELLPGQRGVKFFSNKYMAIVNPGITIPGDLTIPTIKHELQIIDGKLKDMLMFASELTNRSIYFNGPMAGASCPHFHFQAGIRDRLPAEMSINDLLNDRSDLQIQKNIIYQNNDAEIFAIDNFLRSTICCFSSDLEFVIEFGNSIIHSLKEINKQFIKNIPNIPDFGTYIDVFGRNETEARFNIMAKYYPDSKKYLLVFFPKLFNRGQSFFQKDKISLGFAIKEALGHVITANKKDYYKILNNIDLLKQVYQDTSITKTMEEALLHQLGEHFNQ
jgi:hypothetical protein